MALAKTPQEIFALQSFMKVVEDLELDQGTIMRFLRARNLDLTKAEGMLRAHVSWRRNNIFEPALNGWKPPKEFMLKFECYHCGFDKDGRSVFYISFDNWMPSRELFEKFESFDFMLFAYKTFLILYEDIVKSQHQQVVAILDNEGVGFTKIFHEIQQWTGVQTLIDIWQLYEANFPETLHKAFFINSKNNARFVLHLRPCISVTLAQMGHKESINLAKVFKISSFKHIACILL